MVSRHLSRFCARTALAAAGLAGAALFILGVKAQMLRFWLFTRHGLGFADPSCTTGYCDYGMFWLAGFLVRHGQAGALYEPARYAALAAQTLPYKTGWWPFVYPPTMLLPAWGISALPFVAGYYAVSGLLLLAAVRLLRAACISWPCIGAGLVSFPAMWNLYLGQFGLLCGALLVYGLAAVQTRPHRAGAALGLLAIKPQYALLVPVAVLAARRWRAMFAGGVTLAVLLALSWILAGTEGWLAYLGPGRAAMTALLEQKFAPGYQVMGTSVFWMLRSLHAGIGPAYAGQALVSAACAAASWRLWRRGGPAPLIPTVMLALLASPYGFIDDLAIYAVLLPALARRGAPWHNAALAWLWLAPDFIPACVAHLGFLPTPLLLTGALVLAWRNTRSPAAEIPAPAPRFAMQPQ